MLLRKGGGDCYSVQDSPKQTKEPGPAKKKKPIRQAWRLSLPFRTQEPLLANTRSKSLRSKPQTQAPGSRSSAQFSLACVFCARGKTGWRQRWADGRVSAAVATPYGARGRNKRTSQSGRKGDVTLQAWLSFFSSPAATVPASP